MSKSNFVGFRHLQEVDIQYFSNDSLFIGDLCFLKGDNLVTNYKLASIGSEIIGLSMYNVILADINNYRINQRDQYEVPSGSKIQILRKGTICLQFPVKWKIPRGQKLYADAVSGKISWRKGLKYCKTTSAQDTSGHILAEVNFD